ncbi:MAG: methylmalonyl-CoA mutase, partial [Myxococcota bacterium]
FAQRLFEAGGFEVITNDGFTRPEAIAEAFATSQAHGAAICGTDQAYQAQADAVAAALYQHHPAFITLAGRPGDDAEAWQAAGVTHYAHLGCDALALLVDLHSRIEPGS